MADEPWTIGRVLAWTTAHFAERGIDSPRLDAELLLAHVLEQKRVYLYTHYDQPLSQAERDAYRAIVQRRQKREPVAYILGEREFYGRSFLVNRDVLVPRPETEHLIDAVREWAEKRATAGLPHEIDPAAELEHRRAAVQKARAQPFRIADVGTGSGAIAVTLAAELPNASVTAVDTSKAALAVAQENAGKHGVAERVRFVAGDLLNGVSGPFDVIAANLPYIPEAERTALMPEVRDFEPAQALFGGADGLELIRKLVTQAREVLVPEGLLALEIGAGQWPAVRALLQDGFSHLRAAHDLAGHPRIALAERALTS